MDRTERAESPALLVEQLSPVEERIKRGKSMGTVITENGRRVIVLDEVIPESVAIIRTTPRRPGATTLMIGNIPKPPRGDHF